MNCRKDAFSRGGPEDLGVEAFEEPRPPRRGRTAQDESPDQGLAENVVAAENLVRPFARADDLDPLFMDEAGEEEHRHGRGPQYGRFAVPDDPRESGGDERALRLELMVLDTEERGHLALMSALVERRCPAKRTPNVRNRPSKFREIRAEIPDESNPPLR